MAIPPVQLTMLDARDRVVAWLNQEPYLRYQPELVPSNGKPLELPDGWRFPFDLFVEGIRVRQAILILFIDRTSGAITPEVDNTAQIAALERQVLQSSERPALDAKQYPPTGAPWRQTNASFAKIAERVRAELKDADVEIETAERVWDRYENRLVLAWRFGLRRGLARTRLLVPLDAEASPAREEPSDTARSAGRWSLDGATFGRGRLSVRLPRGDAEARARWAVWSCMASTSSWLRALGYNAVGPENVDVLFDPASAAVQRDGAACDRVNGTPVIGFRLAERWAEDPSIVLHELGHAIWFLLFARQPASIDEAHRQDQVAVEEGFADYVAAAQLERSGLPRTIGGGLRRGVGKQYRLPRDVEARPYAPADGDPHEIGHQWANLLWDVRERVLAQTQDLNAADRAVLAAHLRPPEVPNGSGKPLERYLQSLALATGGAVPQSRDWWPEIAKAHGVGWAPPAGFGAAPWQPPTPREREAQTS